jgi:malate permease and related proteins
MQILTTIIPIFTVIFIGWFARLKGFIPPEFLGPANRLVYYLAIPAMVFRAIAKASFRSHFNPGVLAALLGSILLIFGLSWIWAALGRFPKSLRGTFMQSAFHGNLGYIGLAVSYYFLGEEGLAHASILTGFVMIFHNFLAVVVLSVYGEEKNTARGPGEILRRILVNPIILSAIAGITASLLRVPLPAIADRSLDILGNLALPLALLLIGASLSLERMRSRTAPIIGVGVMKLMAMPALGFGLFSLWGIPSQVYLPGLILLASPSATVVYVMAREMGGDADLAVGVISATTLLSAGTFAFWLHIGMG